MVLLDSSFLIAYYNQTDIHHKKSFEIMKEIGSGEYGQPIIPDSVFNEVVNVLFNRLKNHSMVVKVCEDILSFTTIFHSNELLFKESWKIFKEQSDFTKLSFTDCSIIALMKKENIKKIATFDKDFSKIKGIEIIN